MVSGVTRAKNEVTDKFDVIAKQAVAQVKEALHARADETVKAFQKYLDEKKEQLLTEIEQLYTLESALPGTDLTEFTEKHGFRYVSQSTTDPEVYTLRLVRPNSPSIDLAIVSVKPGKAYEGWFLARPEDLPKVGKK